jgi:hypothetical protein
MAWPGIAAPLLNVHRDSWSAGQRFVIGPLVAPYL